jgi:hypothetical protein
LLRGLPAGSWLKVECLATTLLEMSGASGPEVELLRIKEFYLEANDVTSGSELEARGAADFGVAPQVGRSSYGVGQPSAPTPDSGIQSSPSGNSTLVVRLPTGHYEALRGMSEIVGRSVQEIVRQAVEDSLRNFASSSDFKDFETQTQKRLRAMIDVQPF